MNPERMLRPASDSTALVPESDLRDQFAIAALGVSRAWISHDAPAQAFAKLAYEIADAMLEERRASTTRTRETR